MPVGSSSAVGFETIAISQRRPRENVLIFVCAFISFAAVHLPVDKMQELFGLGVPAGATVRGLLFTTAIVPVLSIVVRGLARHHVERLWNWKLFVAAVVAFATLSCLVVPGELRSQGEVYGSLSGDPFNEPYDFYHRRVFVPFLAHVLGWQRGTYYLIFSLLLAFLVLYGVSVLLFGGRSISAAIPAIDSLVGKLPEVDLSRWSWPDKLLVLTSTASSSFFIFNFQYPGYVDAMVFIALVLMALLPLDVTEIRALSVVMLATTEAACWPLCVLYLLFLSRRDRLGNLLLLVIYGVLWLSIMKFNVAEVFARHTTVGKPGMQILVENLPRLAAGVVLAYKLLWIVPILTWMRGLASSRQLLLLTVMLASPFSMMPLIDTSRLIGWGFLGFLLCLVLLLGSAGPGRGMYVVRVVLALNLWFPSVYCGTNTGIIAQPGLYARLASTVRWRP